MLPSAALGAPLVRLSDADSLYPAVAAEGSDVYVVWVDEPQTDADIVLARSDDGGLTWQEPVLVRAIDGRGVDSVPVIAVEGGVLHVAYSEPVGSFPSSRVRYLRSPDGGDSWDLDILLSPDASVSIRPDLAAEGEEVHVVWMEGYDIVYRRSSDGGATWSAADPLAITPLASWSPALEVEGESLHVVWRERAGFVVGEPAADEGYLDHVRSTDGGITWSAPTRLATTHTHGFDIVWKPGLAASGGDVHVAWWSHNGDAVPMPGDENMLVPAVDVFYVRSLDDGESWEPAIQLTATDHAHSPFLAESDGELHAVWVDRESLYHRSSTSEGARWSEPMQVTDDSATGLSGVAAEGGVAHAVWSEGPPDEASFVYYVRIEREDLEGAVDALIELIEAIPPSDLKNENNARALVNKVEAVAGMIDAALAESEPGAREGQLNGAIEKLGHDVLAKMDGCASDGEPDKNDWIQSCDEQAGVYEAVLALIARLTALL